MAVGKYTTVANAIRKDIMAGRYGIEGGLPATPDLMQAFGVALSTVKQALGKLEGEGIIRKRGANYYVNMVHTTMTSFVPLPNVRHAPRGSFVRTLHAGFGEVPEHLLEKVQHPTQQVFTRTQVAGDIEEKECPLQLTHRYYFIGLNVAAQKRLTEDPTWDPMWELKQTLKSRDEIASRKVTKEEAEVLSLPDETSVLSLFEVIRDTAGTLLMLQEIVLSPRETLIFEFDFQNVG